MRRHGDRYADALAEDVVAALEDSVGQFAEAVGVPFHGDELHAMLDAAPFGSWDTVLETYVRKRILPRLFKQLGSTFEDRLFKGLDQIVGLKGQEVEFWEELESRMEGRPFGDYYDVAPDLMDEFYDR